MQHLKKQAIKNIRDFKDICDRLGIDFCLMDGTLLGAYRDKDIIKGDEDDIDLGIMDKDYRIMEIIDEMEKIGFDTSKRLWVKGRIEGLGAIRGGTHIDVIRINTDENGSYNLANNIGGGHVAYTYPKIEKFIDIEFLGDTYKAPENIEEFLEHRYTDWKTPLGRDKYDYLSFKDVPGLKIYKC